MNTVMRTATSSKACASAVPIFQFVKCAAPRRPQQHRWAPDVSSFRSVERHNVQRREVRVLAAAAPPPGLTCEPWTGSAEQQQALEKLKQLMASGPNGVPDEETLKWFLRDRYFVAEDAAEKLNSMLSWRNAFQPGPVNFADIEAEYATGKSVVHEHLDRYGRPGIIITARHHKTGAFPIDASKRLCVHTIDGAIAKLPPGKEQIIGVFDLRGFGGDNMDLAFVKFMIDAFFEYYPKRVGQVLFVDAPWVFQPAWQVIKPLMRKYAALVQFVSSEQVASEFYTPETAPAQLGK